MDSQELLRITAERAVRDYAAAGGERRLALVVFIPEPGRAGPPAVETILVRPAGTSR